MFCPFAIRPAGGQSGAYPNLDDSRISAKASQDSLGKASGIFHMTKRSSLLSICRTGIHAGGIGGTRRHSFFGPIMITDGRNVSGGRGEKPDAENAGVCIGVNK